LIRKLSLVDQTTTEADANLSKVFGEDPFATASMLFSEAWKTLLGLEAAYAFCSRFYHRLLIFVSIRCDFLKRGENPTFNDSNYAYARQAVCAVLQNEVSEIFPAEALALRKIVHGV